MGEESPRRLTVTIVGMGLMGGSLGMALYENEPKYEIIGVDRNKDTLARAIEKHAAHRTVADISEAAPFTDILVLATPIREMPHLAQEAALHMRPGSIVTDLGSTKAYLAKEMPARLPGSITYIGGHPMAGSEKSGIEAARKDLLKGATYVLCPPDGIQEDSRELLTLRQMVRVAGAREIFMEPEQHDIYVAIVSHLPYLCSVALAGLALKKSQDFPSLSRLMAGGFRDSTRTASRDPLVGADICLTNPEALENMASEFNSIIEEIMSMVRKQDIEGLRQKLRDIKLFRDSLKFPPSSN